ncbi:MAG: hypothetical protein JSS09_04110, partial [Verrucomicrobia bacterium]|nr:hypothetical protein [Verrucomicrobiota bacterium]
WGGRKGDSGKLKAAITGDTVWIESKGKDKISIPNYRKFIAASNERFALPLDADDRRWLVLDCSGHRVHDKQYFDNLAGELEHGGYEAFLYELQSRDLSEFNPRKLPTNDNSFDLKLQCSSSFVQYMYSALDEERLDLGTSNGCPWHEVELIIRTDMFREYYKDFCSKEKLYLLGEKNCGWILKSLFEGTSFKKDRRRYSDRRHSTYTFPSLSIARSCLARYFRISDERKIFDGGEQP